MAVRTISRDKANPRVVLVWPASVCLDDVKTNDNDADYALDNGDAVVPTAIPADMFKSAFGFVPCSGTKGRYIVRRAHAPETAEDKLVAGITALVKDVLNQD
jgi:hypothetical protein